MRVRLVSQKRIPGQGQCVPPLDNQVYSRCCRRCQRKCRPGGPKVGQTGGAGDSTGDNYVEMSRRRVGLQSQGQSLESLGVGAETSENQNSCTKGRNYSLCQQSWTVHLFRMRAGIEHLLIFEALRGWEGGEWDQVGFSRSGKRNQSYFCKGLSMSVYDISSHTHAHTHSQGSWRIYF